MLGHHALPSRSVVTYSRELLAAPLRQLGTVQARLPQPPFDRGGGQSFGINLHAEHMLQEPHDLKDSSLQHRLRLQCSPRRPEHLWGRPSFPVPHTKGENLSLEILVF